jgi:hypothetical protein
MVQNAGFSLENGQNKRRERLERVAIYLLYSLYFRWNGVKIRAEL